eukprot:CAMPEP_0113299916 /NCGR_PEP_ID=MMETSP0010_2-20120614/1760_1 /TAXON_ID=216773 ORGANISM="Corethron hystrix, Strain 308" /NCGR_SAMPLE_ID=MMETSP0010_2 /ASSEMBLY_ACC=CAM_ASM_000155 /LENGTH=271 /DNA_ID=CAMNT_0000153247 /DNA_START=87 /DNA_END=898 /DNA_ORIENTATION=+ /assembly_acc=CAM_ASM_000155
MRALRITAITLLGLLSPASTFSPQPRKATQGVIQRAFSDPVLDADGTPSPALYRAALAFRNFSSRGGIDTSELASLLAHLNLDATPEERRSLFKYLDADGDGQISLHEFLGWYGDAAEASTRQSRQFQNMLMSRRTVNAFDTTPVDDAVLRRAVSCAVAAPNRSGSEPWRFIRLGSATVAKLQRLNARVIETGGGAMSQQQQRAPLLPEAWPEIPGWVAVTSALTPGDPEAELADFRSTSCAMQNLMLSLWSEGVGSKWTEGPMQKTQQFA